MQHPVLNVGVDVAKDTVVVACAAHSFPVKSVSNQRASLRAWLKALPAGSRIGLESTGAYHELLADLAQAQGHTVFLLNPLDTRYYAKAMGTRAKTDRMDAELIARLIAQEHPRLRPYRFGVKSCNHAMILRFLSTISSRGQPNLSNFF